MTTLRVRRVRLFSAGKMLGFVFAVLGFLAGIPLSLVAFGAGGLSVAQAGEGGGTAVESAAALGLPIPAFAIGIGAIVVFPLVYGFLGFLVGFVHALVYNVVASFMGGLVLETD